MRRLTVLPLKVMLVLVLAAVVPQQAFGPPSMQAGQAPAPSGPLPSPRIPLDLFQVPDGFEVTLWAASPLLHNPTNIDIDRDGRIWVAEGVRYRSHHARQPEGDRIVVLQDTDGDGKADKHAYVRAGTGADRAARRLGHRQQDHRRAAARPDRLHRRRSEPALRSGGGQARGAADRLPGHQSRPLAALGDGRPGRQVGVQRRQHRGDVHGSRRGRRSASSAPIVPARSARSSSRTTRRSMPASRATTGTCTSADSPCA